MNAEERKELGRKFEEEMRKLGINVQDIPNGVGTHREKKQEVWIIKDSGKR